MKAHRRGEVAPAMIPIKRFGGAASVIERSKQELQVELRVDGLYKVTPTLPGSAGGSRSGMIARKNVTVM